MPEAFFIQKQHAMENNFKIMTDAFEKAGIDITKAEYSITEYSLNTDLSFRFSNREEFLQFLGLNAANSNSTKKIEAIDAMIMEQNIDPKNFFYVNFYPPKVVEM